MAYAQEGAEGCYTFALTAKATEKCKVPSSLHEQQDCALFVQAMCVLHGSARKNDITATCFDNKGLPSRILSPAGAVKCFSRWCGQNHWHRHESGHAHSFSALATGTRSRQSRGPFDKFKVLLKKYFGRGSKAFEMYAQIK